MRRKVAAICVSALTLAVSGGALAAGEGQSGSQQRGQQSESQGSQTGSEAQQGSSASGQQQGSATEQAPSSAEESMPSEQPSGRAPAQPQQGAGSETISYSDLNKDQVKQIQRKLHEDGRYQGNIDGIIGPKTIAALNDFQAQQGLRGGGALNRETLEALGLDWAELQAVSGREAEGAQQAPAVAEAARQPAVGKEGVQLSQLGTEQVRELQQKLQDMGFYQGKVDGIVGKKTRAALQQFYSRQAQLAARGMITEDGALALGMDVSAAQPVRGAEEAEPEPTRQQPAQPQERMQQAPEGTQPQGTEPQGTQPKGTQPQGQRGTSPAPKEESPSYDPDDERRSPSQEYQERVP